MQRIRYLGVAKINPENKNNNNKIGARSVYLLQPMSTNVGTLKTCASIPPRAARSGNAPWLVRIVSDRCHAYPLRVLEFGTMPSSHLSAG